MAGSHVRVERPARRRRGRQRYYELAAGTCVRSVAAMAYGLFPDAESAPTPAGTMTVISWPVFGARTRRCEPGPAPCGQITGNVAGGGAAAAVTVGMGAIGAEGGFVHAVLCGEFLKRSFALFLRAPVMSVTRPAARCLVRPCLYSSGSTLSFCSSVSKNIWGYRP